jgi:hypothetical protein
VPLQRGEPLFSSHMLDLSEESIEVGAVYQLNAVEPVALESAWFGDTLYCTVRRADALSYGDPTLEPET